MGDIMQSTNEINSIMKKLPQDQRDYLNSLLKNAPKNVLDSFQIISKEKNAIVVEENTVVDRIYILLEGAVKAIDYRIVGIVYDYMWFYPIKVFGSMEILLHMEKYRTTLMTASKCRFLVISKRIFENWIHNDVNALLVEINEIGNYLLEQGRRERIFLFIQGIDRLYYLFMQIYEKSAVNNKCVIRLTRKELAERLGLSIKTINRCVKKVQEEGYICREGNKIVIEREQYMKMKEYISSIVEQI